VAAIADVPTPTFAADLSYQSCRKIRLTCRGFEPNWSFTLPGNGTIQFVDPQSPNYPAPLVIQACASGSGSQINITAGAPLNLTATVTQQSCTEPSGQVRPRKITISYQQGAPGHADFRHRVLPVAGRAGARAHAQAECSAAS
jgi:hypothetical protein